MKKMITATLVLMAIGTKADMIKPLDSLSIQCHEDVGFLAVMPNTISVDFFEDSMVVDLNGEEREFDNVILKAGTEGGTPYIQFVQNGFVNFIISGPQLDAAFVGKEYKPKRGEKPLSIMVNDLRDQFLPDFSINCIVEDLAF